MTYNLKNCMTITNSQDKFINRMISRHIRVIQLDTRCKEKIKAVRDKRQDSHNRVALPLRNSVLLFSNSACEKIIKYLQSAKRNM